MMRRAVIAMLAVSVLLGISSCGSSYMLKQDTKPEIKADPDKAVLVIVRGTSCGWAVSMSNYLDGKFIGETQGKCYFITKVDPGVHYVVGSAENNACARFDFQAGKIYYLLQTVFMGIWKARTGYSAISPEDARKDIPDCSFLALDPSAKADDMDAKDYKQTVDDFEKEVKTDPNRHKDVLEYKGY